MLVIPDGSMHAASTSAAGQCRTAGRAAGAPVDFNRDVRPILSQNCFRCHGIDDKARKGKLRLVFEGADGTPIDGVRLRVVGADAARIAPSD